MLEFWIHLEDRVNRICCRIGYDIQEKRGVKHDFEVWGLNKGGAVINSDEEDCA